MAKTWDQLSACDLGRGIEARQIDPVDLAQFFLDRIAGHEAGDRIYARLTADRALAEAGAAADRAKAGQRLSLLDGVPCSWKDLYDTAGVATESGSALLKGRIPEADAEVLRNATAAGMVCLGKVHQTELAFSGLGVNTVTATPPNVNDPEWAPGGSSSGSGASVALGLAPISIGSDTAGSVRIPAAWNDLVGLKTTHGALPLTGVVPLCPRFDTVGPLAKTVEDAAHMFAAMAGEAPADLDGATLSGAKLLILDTLVQDGIDDAVRQGFDGVVAKFEAAGAEIARAEIPAVTDAIDLGALLFAAEAYGVWRDVIEANPDVMFHQVLKRFRGGADYSAAEYVAGWRRLDELRVEFQEATAGYDAVLTPSIAIQPPKVSDLLADEDGFAERNFMALRNTRVGSMMGLCGLTLPTGVPSTGILLNGSAGADRRLLRLGAAAEAALAA